MAKGNRGAMRETNDIEPTPDEDTPEQAPATAGISAEPDDMNDADDFEIDASLIPSDIELEELAPDFVRPEGFLMVPRLNPKTGEIFPQNATFAGILNDIVPWVDNRKKERVWYACTATADIPGAMYTGKDEKGVEFRKPVKKGDRIGISGSGAINALKTKKGHFVYLHWTGAKVQVKNGQMWEIKAKVSKEPMKAPF